MVIVDSSDSAGTNAPGPGLLQAACALTFPRTFPLTFPRAEFFRYLGRAEQWDRRHRSGIKRGKLGSLGSATSGAWDVRPQRGIERGKLGRSAGPEDGKVGIKRGKLGSPCPGRGTQRGETAGRAGSDAGSWDQAPGWRET